MSRIRWALIPASLLVLAVSLSRWDLRAQSPESRTSSATALPSSSTIGASPERHRVQDALIEPFDLPFRQPTSLDEVASRLQQLLGLPVVLDKAALIRLNLEAADTVQLELKGVRLKTSLQLLLDQVGMTYRSVPEDNLLILTDDRGADDPTRRILEQISVLHEELHDLRDLVDEIRLDALPRNGQTEMRKPTIIEEMPREEAVEGAPETELPRTSAPRNGRGRRST